jgi:hypothetical protein
MKPRALLSALFLSLCMTRAEALTDKGKEALKQLEAAMAEEVKASKPKEGEELSRQGYSKASMAQSLKMLLAEPDSSQLVQSLAQFSSHFTSEGVLKSMAALQEEIRLERENSEQAYRNSITEALNRAASVVREAKTASDLDATITELGKLRRRNEYGRSSPEIQTLTNQVEPTLQFATQWQNYLAAKAAGNKQQAIESLSSITNNSIFLIPRSEILALIEQNKMAPKPPGAPSNQETVDGILSRIKSLADLENALVELDRLRDQIPRGDQQNEINSVRQNLSPIDKTYQEFKAGLAVNIETNSYHSNGDTPGNKLIASLRAELMLLVLTRFVGAPEGTAAKPGEDVQQFLDRLANEAKERGDTSVVLRSRQALQLIQRGNAFSGADTEGLRAFVSGKNQEAAGQYMLAVMSYQAALKSGSDLVPAKAIGESLAAIQAAHPKEYEAGLEKFLNPPRPQFDPYSGMRGQPDFPGRGRPEQNQQPALSIPPVSVPTAAPANNRAPGATSTSATMAPTPASSPAPASTPAPVPTNPAATTP